MDTKPLGADLPRGARFIGPEPGHATNWALGDAPTQADLNACVACGLCLPHCPTYRLTGEESASPRGRIAAMRAVQEGRAPDAVTGAAYVTLALDLARDHWLLPEWLSSTAYWAAFAWWTSVSPGPRS